MKPLLLVLGIIVLIVWYKRRASALAAAQQQKRPKLAIQPMLRCEYCGVHFPATDAPQAPDGRIFCCQAHRQIMLGRPHA